MIKKLNYGLFGLLSLYSCAVTAHTDHFTAHKVKLDPYFGIDAQYNHMRFNEDDGARFKKWAPQTNGYVGVQFHRNFAIEVGYESSKRTKNEIEVAAGTNVLGRIAPVAEIYLLEVKSRAFLINFVGFYPIYKHIDFIGSIGLSRVNMTGYDTLYQRAAGIDDITSKMYSKSKNVLDLNCGLKYMLNSNFGFRAMIGWQNTSKLQPLNGQLTTNSINAKLKNNFKSGIGIISYIY